MVAVLSFHKRGKIGISGEFKRLDLSSSDSAPSEEFFTDESDNNIYSNTREDIWEKKSMKTLAKTIDLIETQHCYHVQIHSYTFPFT